MQLSFWHRGNSCAVKTDYVITVTLFPTSCIVRKVRRLGSETASTPGAAACRHLSVTPCPLLTVAALRASRYGEGCRQRKKVAAETVRRHTVPPP